MTVKHQKKQKRVKYWEICEGNCKTCWPMVYKHCRSPKKTNRVTAILEEMIRKEDERDIITSLIKKIARDGFIEGINVVTRG